MIYNPLNCIIHKTLCPSVCGFHRVDFIHLRDMEIKNLRNLLKKLKDWKHQEVGLEREGLSMAFFSKE